MNRINFTVVLCCVMIVISGCAGMLHKQGNHLYENLAYKGATVKYEKALARKEIPDARIKLADSYRQINNSLEAEKNYAKVVQLKESNNMHKVFYADALIKNGKCEHASFVLENLLAEDPSNKHAIALLQSCEKRASFMVDSLAAKVEKMNINSANSDFAPAFYKDGIVFSSERKEAKPRNSSDWTGRPYLDLYFSKEDKDNKWTTPVELKGDVNSKYHDGPAAFSKDSSVIYFTRNTYFNSKVKRDALGIVNLALYSAKWIDGEWKDVKPLNLNNPEYSVGHPALSTDGKTLYFISDMPGGYGGTDLYKSKMQADSTWGKPENLGAKINTHADEMTPSVYNDSLLFFSSEGHPGMGGMDVFESVISDKEFSDVVNVGYPVNTTGDDMGYILSPDMKHGYFSSNRDGNGEIDNLYGFVKVDLMIKLSGLVVDKISQEPLDQVVVELVNKETGKTETVITGPDGTFNMKLDPKANYTLNAKKDGYVTKIMDINKDETKPGGTKIVKVEMEKIVVDQPVVIENIFYDFDKANVRPDAALELDKLVAYLNERPDLNIELGSHCDSRGADAYNLDLSQQRAESAVNYLVKKGINKDRLSYKGYGETELVNKCSNGVPCSAEEHQQNRRTEFKIVRKN